MPPTTRHIFNIKSFLRDLEIKLAVMAAFLNFNFGPSDSGFQLRFSVSPALSSRRNMVNLFLNKPVQWRWFSGKSFSIYSSDFLKIFCLGLCSGVVQNKIVYLICATACSAKVVELTYCFRLVLKNRHIYYMINLFCAILTACIRPRIVLTSYLQERHLKEYFPSLI